MIDLLNFNDVLKKTVSKKYLALKKAQNYYVKHFDGNWIELDNDINIIGCYFIGYNEILSENELYISIFFPNPVEDSSKHRIKKSVERLKKNIQEEYEFKYVYYQVFCQEAVPFETLYNIGKKYNVTLISCSIEKEITRKNSIFDIASNIRYAKQKDYDDIADSLVKSYNNAFEPNLYGELDSNVLQEKVENYYKNIIDTGLTLIAEVDNNFAGHITYKYKREDKNTNYLHMVDMLVKSNYKGLGIEKSLTRAGEVIAFNKNINRITGIVDVIGAPKGIPKALNIMSNLKRDGWKRESILFFEKNKT